MDDKTFTQLQLGEISTFRANNLHGMKKVLAEDFDRSSIDSEGNNALHLVCMPKRVLEDSSQAIRLVITNGVSVDARNSFSFTPLMLAA